MATEDTTARGAIEEGLHGRYKVEAVRTRTSFVRMFQTRHHEICFVDIRFLHEGPNAGPSMEAAREALGGLTRVYPTAEIVIMADQAAIRQAVYTVKAGASNYLTYPIDAAEVGYVIENLLENRKQRFELDYLRDQIWDHDSLHFATTRSPVMTRVFDKIRSVAATRTTVLLSGETGTGKGVMAKLIHRNSNRRRNQFISVHCGAIPDTLLESELFGHEKGAFTGADKRRAGKFEIAHGGTIFLDEIGTISPAAQIKLLQVLQDRTFQRVGGEVTLESEARIVAATNADLKRMADTGDFRKDLYYRLNVFPIEIPALRDRREDIPLLVSFFLERLNRLYGKEIREVHPSVLQTLEGYEWPGNIRELENILERSYILENGPALSPENFPGDLFATGGPVAQIPLPTNQSLAEVRKRAVEKVERQYLQEVLTTQHGRIDKSAREAGISTRQFHKLLVKYGIRKEDHKS